MPRISFRDYQSGSRPWWEYLGDAGQAVAGGISDLNKERRQDAQIAAQKAATDRNLAIEEARAQVALAHEANTAAARDERQASQDADRRAAVQGLQELAGEQQRDAVAKGIDAAIRSPGGALGPFGVLSSAASGAAQGLAAAPDFAPKVELARQMSPAGARMYLQREAADAKQQTIAAAYQKEADAVLAGVKDGVLTPQMGQQMVQALQSGLRSGHPPGQVHAQVAHAYDLHAKVQKRLAGWEEADRKASEAVGALETMATNAEDPDVRQKLLQQIAKAKGEWGRTQVESFRQKNDGEASLAGLEKIIFGAQAAQGDIPTGIQYSSPPPTRDEVIAATKSGGATGTEPDFKGRGAAPPEAPKRATPPTAVPPADKTKIGQTVRNYVAANGEAVVSQDAENRPRDVGKMLLALAKELGLNPRDPYLEGVLTDALVDAQLGKLPFSAAPAAGPRKMLDLAPAGGGARPGSGLGPGGM